MIHLVSEIPFGPKLWSKQYEELVQISNNNGIIKTEENVFKVIVNSRTSNMKDFYDNQRILSELINFGFEQSNVLVLLAGKKCAHSK